MKDWIIRNATFGAPFSPDSALYSPANEAVLAKPEHAVHYTSAMSVQIPTLDVDKAMYARLGHRLTTMQRRERRIVANLIAHLNARGFLVVAVDDGGDAEIPITDNNMKDAMDAAFTVMEATMYFVYHSNQPGTRRYSVDLIFGNGNDGMDVISNSSTGGLFDAALDAFDAEVWA